MSLTQAFGNHTDYTKLLQHDVEEEEKGFGIESEV